MKQDFSITRKFWNGVKIEIRFERYAIQFDDGQWKSIVEIESMDGKSLPFSNKTFKKIIIEADKVDGFDNVAEFAFDYLNSNKQSGFFKAPKFPNPSQLALF
ncbi:MAG: hypothetical protein LCH83_13750 [Proteobacteria bacterium]|nr:hypothetical protein [Pseudomonadota bacterium]